MSGTPELEIDARWDRLVDLSLRRLSFGIALGGATALVLFSKSRLY